MARILSSVSSFRPSILDTLSYEGVKKLFCDIDAKLAKLGEDYLNIKRTGSKSKMDFTSIERLLRLKRILYKLYYSNFNPTIPSSQRIISRIQTLLNK